MRYIDDRGVSAVRDVLFRVTAAATAVPVIILFTALGAGVMIGRGLLRLLSNLLPSPSADAPTRRHDAGRVRERATAAEQAARASGLLSRRDR